MKIAELRKIESLSFGCEDIAKALGINTGSARVAASRYTKQGILLRMKRNMYVREEAWRTAGGEDKFRLANMGQVPSYISLMTALGHYEVTTQIQRDYFESVAVRRSKELELGGSTFRYVKLAGSLYSTFRKENGYFIATPEKALLDAFYLMSYGRYSLDVSSLDPEKLNRREIEHISGSFPTRTKELLNRHGYL